MSSVLVTGASGFIGRAVCRLLRETGHAVIEGDRSNLGDLRSPDFGARLDQLLPGVDFVIHLAGLAHVISDRASTAPSDYQSINVDGTRRLAEASVRAHVRRLIYVSSAKVNGDETVDHPFRETDPPQPTDPYSESKYEAESILFDVASSQKLEVTCVRPPLVYGPGVRANFGTLLTGVARGIPFPLGSVRNRRSLIYVLNLADAILQCMSNAAAKNELFLVSDGPAPSSKELVEQIAHAMGRSSKVFPFPMSALRCIGALPGKTRVIHRLVNSLEIDDQKIRALLGWAPPYTFKQGIEDTVAWFQNPQG